MSKSATMITSVERVLQHLAVLLLRPYASGRSTSRPGSSHKTELPGGLLPQIHAEMTVRDRVMQCECGTVLDRDRNAAVNIMVRFLSQNALWTGYRQFAGNLRQTGLRIREIPGHSQEAPCASGGVVHLSHLQPYLLVNDTTGLTRYLSALQGSRDKTGGTQTRHEMPSSVGLAHRKETLAPHQHTGAIRKKLLAGRSRTTRRPARRSRPVDPRRMG